MLIVCPRIVMLAEVDVLWGSARKMATIMNHHVHFSFSVGRMFHSGYYTVRLASPDGTQAESRRGQAGRGRARR